MFFSLFFSGAQMHMNTQLNNQVLPSPTRRKYRRLGWAVNHFTCMHSYILFSPYCIPFHMEVTLFFFQPFYHLSSFFHLFLLSFFRCYCTYPKLYESMSSDISGPNLGPTSREKWLLPPAQIGRSGGPEGEVTTTVHAKWWMMQYYERKKNQKLIYCFIKTLNILKLSSRY